MRAIVVDGGGGAAAVTLPDPAAVSVSVSGSDPPSQSGRGTARHLEPDEIVIRVCACSVSREDVDECELPVSASISAPVGEENSSIGGVSERILGCDVSGVVAAVGSGVEMYAVGDEVVCILPRHSHSSGGKRAGSGGCADFCVARECCVARKPAELSHVSASFALSPGIAALDAIFVKCNVQSNDLVLVIGAGTDAGYIAVQLAISRGAFVFAAVSSNEGVALMNQFVPSVVRVIDGRTERVSTAVVQETDGVGVHHVVELGYAPNFQAEEALSPAPGEILDCLGPHAIWATRRRRLQLDPPESAQLALRGASLAFIYTQSWVACGARRGAFLHMVQEILRRVADKSVSLNAIRQISLPQTPQVLVAAGKSSSSSNKSNGEEWRVAVNIDPRAS